MWLVLLERYQAIAEVEGITGFGRPPPWQDSVPEDALSDKPSLGTVNIELDHESEQSREPSWPHVLHKALHVACYQSELLLEETVREELQLPYELEQTCIVVHKQAIPYLLRIEKSLNLVLDAWMKVFEGLLH